MWRVNGSYGSPFFHHRVLLRDGMDFKAGLLDPRLSNIIRFCERTSQGVSCTGWRREDELRLRARSTRQDRCGVI